MKTADQFQQAAREHSISRWNVHDCGFCSYACGYVFDGPIGVQYDSGCYCTRGAGGLEPRTWKDVANYYNMQTDPPTIAAYAAFWGFGAGLDSFELCLADAKAVREAAPARRILMPAVKVTRGVEDFLSSLARQGADPHRGCTVYVELAGGVVVRVTVEALEAT